MQQKERARHLASLHVKGNPLILYNAWDVGSAKAIADAGAAVIATSSWAVATAQGYEDGECLPLTLLESITARIVATVNLPVTIDAEGGYSDEAQACAANVDRLIAQGVAGINFEDRVVSGTGLHSIEVQCARVAAIRSAADARDIPLFVNARTDVFFGSDISPAEQLAEVLARAAAYEKAGASGLFVPGLIDIDVITRLCNAINLPLNVMVMPGLPAVAVLAQAGVARISHGPGPYRRAMQEVRSAAQSVYASEPRD